MQAGICCKVCGCASSAVGRMISLGEGQGIICGDCVALMAAELGLFPHPRRNRTTNTADVSDPLDLTFTYTFELEGHIDQKYDVFLWQCLMDVLRSEHWEVALELACVTRTDGFARQPPLPGGRRYAVDLLVRANEPVTEEEVHALLDAQLPFLIAANARLLADKGTRDLLEPRLASLASYVVRCAGLPAAL